MSRTCGSSSPRDRSRVRCWLGAEAYGDEGLGTGIRVTDTADGKCSLLLSAAELTVGRATLIERHSHSRGPRWRSTAARSSALRQSACDAPRPSFALSVAPGRMSRRCCLVLSEQLCWRSPGTWLRAPSRPEEPEESRQVIRVLDRTPRRVVRPPVSDLATTVGDLGRS